MYEITRTQKIGKIYQIASRVPGCLHGRRRIVQTFGKPIPGSIKCTTRCDLRKALEDADNMELVVYTISSFLVDDEMYMWMRMSNCRGADLFLYTIENYQVWYADELVLDRGLHG